MSVSDQSYDNLEARYFDLYSLCKDQELELERRRVKIELLRSKIKDLMADESKESL